MLVSYSHRFLFTHIAKAAGSSVEKALTPYRQPLTGSKLRKRLVLLGPIIRLAGLYRHVEFGQHASLSEARTVLPPELFDSFYKFAFVRNPWDRLVSRYHYLKRNTDHHRHHMIEQLSDFDRYLDWEIQRGKMDQYPMVCDRNGKLLANFIGYFENLGDDFKTVCRHLHIAASLPHANYTAHRDYRTYYDSASQKKVAEAFATDIKLFGYDFDGIQGALKS